MSHFYGWVQGNKGEASRGGSKKSGYHTVAASWNGAVEVRLDYDPTTDTNRYIVFQTKWHGKGIERVIAEGVIGEECTSPIPADSWYNPFHDHKTPADLAFSSYYQDGYDDGFKDAMGG